MLRGSKFESSAVSQDRYTSTLGPPRGLEEREERRGDTARAEEVGRLQRDVGELKGLVEKQNADIVRLRGAEKKLTEKYKRREDRVAELKHEIARLRASQQEAVEVQTRQTRGVQERLKKTEELLEARSAELSGAQTFLSTADRLSETEVLSIVRDLNENIFQVAVGLTEGWEKLKPLQAAGRIEVDLTSQPHDLVLVQLARKRDPTGLTFLLQLHLCYLAVKTTSSWAYDRELGVLQSIYQHLSASGEHHIIISLTPSNVHLMYVSQSDKRPRPDGGR